MTKPLLTLAAALLLAGASQALVESWTAANPAGGQDFAQHYAAGTSFTVALVFNGPLPAGTGDSLLLQVSHNPDFNPVGEAGPTLAIRQNGMTSSRDGSGSPADISLDGVTDGTNVFAITVESVRDGSNYDVTYTVYLNDGETPLMTFTHDNVGGGVASFEYFRTGLNGATLYHGEGIATPGQIAALLPEPTALALLALGAAGLALRRRP